MSDSAAGARITISTGAPEGGPTALIAGLVSWGLAVAIVIGGVAWLGSAQATDPRAPGFSPAPLFFGACLALPGTFLLFRGVVLTLRHRKYGMSALDLDEPRLGQTLLGIVRTERELPPGTDFKIRLRCDLHTSTRAIRGGGTGATHCLWDSVQTVPASAVSRAGIPIEMAIPSDGLASGTRKRSSDATERVTWSLEVRAPLPGMDFYAEFPLEVSGHRRRTGESRSGDAAEHPAGARSSRPFAGQPGPRSKGSKLLFVPFLVVGGLLSAAGAFTTWQQIALSFTGFRATGHVVAVSKSVIDVAVDGSGPPPVTVHVLYGSNLHLWIPGMAVRFICREVKEGTRSCRMDTGLERWINTGGTLAVGLGLLLLAWLAWRPRSGGPPAAAA